MCLSLIRDAWSKKIALMLTIGTMSLIILSVGYVVKEANHDCTGEDCPVCVQIEQCLNNFRTLGTGTRIQSEIFVIEKFFEPTFFLYVCLIVSFTLTKQKVRLDF